MGSENRRQDRVKGYAKVLFSPSLTPGYIRDLSRTGCQVSFLTDLPAAAGEVIQLSVLAGEQSGTPPFSFSLRLRWRKSDGLYYSFGGDIEGVSSPEEQEGFEKLVEYYRGYQ
jgi:hypothetical protein